MENRPGPMGPPSTLHFNILADSPKGVVPFVPPAMAQVVMCDSMGTLLMI